VAVRYATDAIELEIADEGPSGRVGEGPSRTANGGGQGLVGMRERVALYGGELHASGRPEGGFVVRASLPIS
jgi:signal transduction histidine kinase